MLEERGDDSETQRHVLSRLARVYEHKLRDNARAEESYLQVLSIDPTDSDALAALDRIYEAGGMWQELADILSRRIGVTTATDEIIELYFRLGRVQAEALDNSAEAVKAYNAVLDNDSRNRRALEALERVYFNGEQWQELFDTYSKMVDIAPGDEGMADCYARMAKIAQDGLADRDKAVDLWGRVIDLRGEDPIALGELANLHEKAEQWRELVDVLERTVRITHDPQEQIPLYQRLGRIWGEKLHRERNSLEAWQKVLEIDPTDVPALRALAAVYKSTQAWEELVETLHKLIDIGIAESDMERQRAHRALRRAGRAAGRDPHAPAGGDRRLAEGAQAQRPRLPRARGARAAVHAGGALGGVHRRPRAEGATRSTSRRRRSRCCCRPRRCGKTRSATATARATCTSASCSSTRRT